MKTANYYSSKVEVKQVQPGTFAWQKYCYCKTLGVPEQMEPAYKRVTVNYYKFKAWLETAYHVTDFNSWYFDYKNTSVFTFALSEYINSEILNRTEYYNAVGEASYKLSEMIALTATNNIAMRKLIGK